MRCAPRDTRTARDQVTPPREGRPWARRGPCTVLWASGGLEPNVTHRSHFSGRLESPWNEKQISLVTGCLEAARAEVHPGGCPPAGRSAPASEFTEGLRVKIASRGTAQARGIPRHIGTQTSHLSPKRSWNRRSSLHQRLQRGTGCPRRRRRGGHLRQGTACHSQSPPHTDNSPMS